MDNKFRIIADALNFMQDTIRNDNAYSNNGTSVVTYWKDLEKFTDGRIRLGETVRTNDGSWFKYFEDIISKQTTNPAKIRQRLDLWTLLGVTKKIKSSEYEIISLNYPKNNLGSAIINCGIKSLYSIDPKEKGTFKTPTKIFGGLFVQLIYDKLGKETLANEILPYLNDRLSKHILDHLEPKDSYKGGNTFSESETYRDLIANDFQSANLDTLVDIAKAILEKRNFINKDNEFITDLNELDDQAIDYLLDIIESTPKTKQISLNEELSKAIRKGFGFNVKKEAQAKSDLQIRNVDNSITYSLCESAHVISVEEIKILLKENRENRSLLKSALSECLNTSNGIYIPFNYHRMFDSNIIEIDWTEGKFVLCGDISESDRVQALNIWGFNNDNKFESKKFERMNKTHKRYLEIINMAKRIH